ncbi:hypothetical protein [Prosthecobacter sp.]|uniref:hypothetical protein n=1 Tax=Prosthecobacter sp. TaxID=1965333 RepID=UPI002AB9E835|nr:hypothetical protein [Prosthecobacter sp.]MDZ4405332.1 hypothetical protein [Prosthecobacter sp.]
MKLASTIAILGSLLTAGSIHAKWSRIPIIKERPVDIAISGPHSNASLDSSSGFGQADAVLSDDITAPATVSAGKSFVVINLGKPVLISQSSFVNDGIEGRATLSASADKKGWAVLEEKVFSAADRTVEFKFAGMQAKFIKLELALSKGGMIRALHFFGGQTDKGYAVKQDKEGKQGKPMDLIGGLGGARVIYAAPKPANGLDTAVTYNKFSFPESDEKYRTVIYDFGQLRILNEFASVHSPRPVRFEVFAFDNLPEKEDWRGRLAFDPTEFNAKSPVAVAEDTRGSGSLKVKPAKPVKTRYLALRWEPEFNPPDFQATGSSTGNVINIVTTNTVIINNSDGTQTVVEVTVTDAYGAGAGSSDVTGDNALQIQSQNGASQNDNSVIKTTVMSAPDPVTGERSVLSVTEQTGTTTVTQTNNSDGGTTTVTETENSDGSSTTMTETTDGNGNTTTTVTNEDAQNNETGSATTTSTDGGTTQTTTSSDGNLGAGNTPNPSNNTPGTPGNGGGTSVGSAPP